MTDEPLGRPLLLGTDSKSGEIQVVLFLDSDENADVELVPLEDQSVVVTAAPEWMAPGQEERLVETMRLDEKNNRLAEKPSGKAAE